MGALWALPFVQRYLRSQLSEPIEPHQRLALVAAQQPRCGTHCGPRLSPLNGVLRNGGDGRSRGLPNGPG
jgi:hypothetical protein